MLRIILFLYIFTFLVNAQSFIKGADVSFIPQLEDSGAVFYENDSPADPLEIFKQNEVNYIRLRLWHSPENGYNNLAKTLSMAQRIKAKGFKFLLNFHYSDTWADPSNQDTPAAWDSLSSFQELIDSVYTYTYDVIKTFNLSGVLPDMVQIGNEIFDGFLWPEGEVDGSTQQWNKFALLLTAASNAVNDSLIGMQIPVMIHIEKGGYHGDCVYFFNQIVNVYEVPFDVIGLSLYPWWHGSLDDLTDNIIVQNLAGMYNKDLVIVETAYPWTLDSLNDNNSNFVTDTLQLHAGYSASVTGQYNFLKDLIQIVKDVPDNRGKGFFYWGPEYISIPPAGSSWENLTLFDFRVNALKSMRVFKEPGIPAVDSIYIEILSESSVRLYADIDSGNDTCAVKFQWDSDSNGVWAQDSAAANSPLTFGTASYTLSNLNQNTDYYFRAYIINSYGSDTSDIRIFRTNPLLNLKLFLQGPYNVNINQMTTALNRNDLKNSPYSEAPESVSYTVPDSITDWVLLQLRETPAGSAILSRSCFLSKNGYLIDPDGLTINVSLEAEPGLYYLVLKHRNHLAVMSSDVAAMNWFTTYDFTSDSRQFFGTGGAVEVESGNWGMWAGDTNNDGGVFAEDYTSYQLNQGLTGYSIISDFNLDGGAFAEDYTTYQLNQGKITKVP